ncbi:MAG: hypothetical protein ACQGVK_24790 [Myxococcota bacterium]
MEEIEEQDFVMRRYTGATRAAAAIGVAVATVSFPALFLAVIFADDPPVTTPLLLRWMALVTFGPALAALALGRARSLRIRLAGDVLVFDDGAGERRIPLGAIRAATPWRIPLPVPGLRLELDGDRPVLQVAGPGLPAFVALLAAGSADRLAAADPGARAFLESRSGEGGLARRLAGIVLLSLVPACVFFYTQQHIAYGGTFAQARLLGWGSFLTSFSIHWIASALHVALWDGSLRGLVAVVGLAWAWLAPRSGSRAGRALRLLRAALVHGGVILFVVTRYV